ncbi:hypothetical protein GPA19_08085 [Azoarcus indigens]|uniref:Uncharacterized protein n=1 Tax=Azoarcus indigens TaxID=29545 RepID=A0A4R6DYM9_9RHOO|nr:hypothetical protein [Azoarcus indigens]NMG64903.1 hypothetical protein [Azoarcus indigens]TDN50441.1 hypothetical protein C7389_109135 [Azoarcus indigens]
MDQRMKQMVDKMRADFARVVAVRKERGEWTQTEEKEIGEAIAAAVKAEDPDMIVSWSCWLADISAAYAAFDLITRGSMARMRVQARQEREDREAAAAVARGGKR